MNNQWSDKLRKRMEAHQEQAPDGLWNDIEQIMLKETRIESAPKSKKYLLWGKRVSAAAVVLLVALAIGYIAIDHNPIDMQLAEEVAKEQPTPESQKMVIESQNGDQISDDVEPSHVYKSSIEKNTFIKKEVPADSIISTTIEVVAKDQTIEEKEENKNIEQQASKPDKVENKSLYTQKEQSLTSEPNFDSYNRSKDRSSKWKTNIYASNLTPKVSNKQSGYGNLSSYAMAMESYDAKDAIAGNAYGNILLANQYEEVYTDIKHKQPITVGLSANYNINDSWCIRSGVTYTLLSSKLHSGGDNNYYYSDQTLHYIGVPVNVNYNIWKNKKISFYVSGGGMAEKNVSGKLETDYIVNNSLENSKKKDIIIDELQWSLNASVGAEYNFSDKVGLYIEPGINYYFKNTKSKIETIYKEKPLNLSLRLGFSFSLGGE